MKKILFVIGLLFIFPLTINASNITASISCPNEKLYVNSTFTCTVTAAPLNGETMANVKATIYYSNNDFALTSINALNSNVWHNNSNTNLDLAMEVPEGSSGETSSIKIASISFKVKNTTSYGTKEIKLTGGNLTSETSSSVKIISKNNNLSNLIIEGSNINFNPNTTTYNIESNKSTLNITATLADNRSHFVEGYGSRKVNLSYGSQQIQVIVVSESNENKVYTINVTRPDNRSSNNNLSTLVVSTGNLSPSFSKTNLSYSVDVPNNVSSITINATLEDSKASFLSNYGPRTVDLKLGENTFLIQVEAENGSAKAYTIKINRSDESSNNYLKSLTLSDGVISFSKNVFDYKVNVLYDVIEIDISALPEDSKATVEIIGNKKLNIGTNNFTIKVISANKSERIYNLVVTRLEQGAKLSSNNYLKNISIDGYKFNFSKTNLDYILNIKQEKTLHIIVTPEESTSIVTITGNENLKNKSKITIKVKAEDESVRNYIITINKKSNTNIILYVMGGVLLVLAILVFFFKDKIFNQKEKINSDVPLNNSRLILKDNKDKEVNESDKELNNKEEKPSVSYKSLEDTLIVDEK